MRSCSAFEDFVDYYNRFKQQETGLGSHCFILMMYTDCSVKVLCSNNCLKSGTFNQPGRKSSPSAGHPRIISMKSYSSTSNNCFDIVMATQLIRYYTQLWFISNPQHSLCFYCKIHNCSIGV